MTKKIKITATAENLEQAKALLDLGIDTLYIGESEYALRLPNTFTWNEIRDITELAHAVGAQVTVAVNAIMHPEKWQQSSLILIFYKRSKSIKLRLVILV
jgi:collagenase-like PrtC family protease